ncbi:hypothetical protein TrVE_jg14109 [Triparma verrucosa]|uniref:Uncharacterized protein n=1 Tax=Triparma verrucosa TaxID=1606542 RepID=A0A9W7BUF1_9STRA|nr:hypothetical protein TrVE_jg14109 [Triparma verrucosa]
MGCCCSSAKEVNEYALSEEVKSPVPAAGVKKHQGSELMVMDSSTAVLGGNPETSQALVTSSRGGGGLTLGGGDGDINTSKKISKDKNPKKRTEAEDPKRLEVEKVAPTKKGEKVHSKPIPTPVPVSTKKVEKVQPKPTPTPVPAPKKKDEKVQPKATPTPVPASKKEEKSLVKPKSAIQLRIEAMNASKAEQKEVKKFPPVQVQAKSAIQLKIEVMNSSSNAMKGDDAKITSPKLKVRGGIADRIASLQSSSPGGMPIPLPSAAPAPNKKMSSMHAKLGAMNMQAMLGGKPPPMRKDKPIEPLYHTTSNRAMFKRDSRRLPSRRKFAGDANV